jgi:hypothetical protein
MAWTAFPALESDELKRRMELMTLIKGHSNLMKFRRTSVLGQWRSFDFATYLDLLLQFGFECRLPILADPRFPFRSLLDPADLSFLLGEVGNRSDSGMSEVPDFLFSESEMFEFLKAAGDEIEDEDARVVFEMVVGTQKLSFGEMRPRAKKRKHLVPVERDIGDELSRADPYFDPPVPFGRPRQP